MRQEPFDRGDDPEGEEPVRLAERATRDLGISVPKLCFELRREVLRRESLRTAELAGLPTQEMERILKEREKEKAVSGASKAATTRTTDAPRAHRKK